MLHNCLEPAGLFLLQMQREGSAVTLLGENLKQTSRHQLQFMYMVDFKLQTGGYLALHGKHCLAADGLLWSPWALDCCCEIVSQLVINYFIKSLFFSFPHHYFHLVSYKLNPVIGKACFSPKWGLGFTEKNTDLRKNVLLIYVVHVHMYAYTEREITVYVYKYCSDPLTLLVLPFTLEADSPSSYLLIDRNIVILTIGMNKQGKAERKKKVSAAIGRF